MATIVLYPFGQGLPIGGPSYIMAWNGLSVPIEEEIPAGVVVTYDSVNYTGTLAASTSTKGKMFLVASSDNPETKDIYVTVSSNNGTYSWMKVGDTDIDLSGNPIKEVPGWLAAKKGLKNLSFSRTKVTALPADLTAWKGLHSLQMGDLNLSATEMARIRKELPDVAIVF